MKFVVVERARHILLMSWSSRFGLAAAVSGGIAQFGEQLPAVQPYIPPHYFSVFAVVCAMAVPVSRIIKQEEIAEAAKPGAEPAHE